jgi:aspartyl-tRNA(Asn)/glutamyl-tRNA(Gln) amidotransferase subunit A
MALPDLPSSLRLAQSDPQAARTLARNAADAVREGEFNTFISVDLTVEPKPDRTSDALLGCVFSVKDNIDVAGLVTTCGSRVFQHAAPAGSDSWIVAALRDVGAQCVGKNNMHEFALGANGANAAFGTTANPWDSSRNCGGSSGGSASAVARRQVHLSIGTDSGGSVRMPAGFVGVAGFKPTPQTLPMDGVAGAAWTIDCLGLFTATVADLNLVWDVIVPAPRTTRSKTLRLAYLADDSMGRVDPGVWALYLESVETLRKNGVEMAGISIPGFKDCPFVCMSIAYPEIASLHYEPMRANPHLYDQEIRGLICLGDIWSSRHYLDAQRLRTVFRKRFADVLAPFDAVLTPSVAIQPPKIGVPAHVEGDPPAQALYTVMRFTVLFNVIGYPAISVPCGLDRDGLPTGVQIIGRPGHDAVLLDIAQRVEDVLGIMPAPPTVGASPGRS